MREREGEGERERHILLRKLWFQSDNLFHLELMKFTLPLFSKPERKKGNLIIFFGNKFIRNIIISNDIFNVKEKGRNRKRVAESGKVRGGTKMLSELKDNEILFLGRVVNCGEERKITPELYSEYFLNLFIYFQVVCYQCNKSIVLGLLGTC
jgi:hypothetical protein